MNRAHFGLVIALKVGLANRDDETDMWGRDPHLLCAVGYGATVWLTLRGCSVALPGSNEATLCSSAREQQSNDLIGY
ncbi:hypothetical protein B0T26DRAFT_711086, partial [Lasiosphaeria miniovina]